MGFIQKFRALAPDQPVLFTHVPKTGGSTITTGMALMLGRDKIAGISTAKPDQRRAFLDRCRRQRKHYVYGHFRYPDTVGIFDGANLIVALRHPLERILSFYFMLLRTQSDFAGECAKDVSGAGFVKFHDWLVRRRREDNLMCRYLCGEPDHKHAVDVLQRHYCLAWDAEAADHAWRELHRGLIGVEPKAVSLKRRNDAPVAAREQELASGARPHDYSTFLPRENVELVADVNSEDIRLFDWCRENAGDAATQSQIPKKCVRKVSSR